MANVLFLIILIGLLTTNLFGDSSVPERADLSQADVSSKQRVVRKQNKRVSPPPASYQESKVRLINTFITAGPQEGEMIEDTNRIRFEFEAEDIPEGQEKEVFFETKLLGIDKEWKKTWRNQRSFTLPANKKEYTFLVRARTDTCLDATPAIRNFELSLSPYFGKIEIDRLKIPDSRHISQIILSSRLDSDETLNITGWSIKGKRSKFEIPKGISRYHHSGRVENRDHIVVKHDDRIYLLGTSSPLGVNFRPNKCMGYLTHSFNFYPYISRDCPTPSQEDISHLDVCCQKFVDRINRCEIPGYSREISNIYIQRDTECLSFISDYFNNDGCYKRYSYDEDFLKNDWYIYFQNRQILAKATCDTLYLRDQNGLVVDSYSYGSKTCEYF